MLARDILPAVYVFDFAVVLGCCVWFAECFDWAFGAEDGFVVVDDGAGAFLGFGDGANAAACGGWAWAHLPAHLPYLAAACGCALLANLAQTFAVRHLPMAISVAIGQALAAIATLIIVLIGGEPLPLSELACIAGVMAGVIVLGFITSHGQKVQAGATILGICACIAFGVAMASALVPLGVVSRQVDPFIAAWGWEAGIGLVGLTTALIRQPLVGSTVIGLRQGIGVGIYTSPTLIGTGAYTYATTLGSLPVAGGVLSAMMIGTAISARLIFKEMLSFKQWLTIAATCLCLVALGLVQAMNS